MEHRNNQVNRNKALDLLKSLVEEMRRLRTLNYNNEEFRTWDTRVKDLLGRAFDDDDYQRFSNAKLRADMRIMGDEIHQNNYQYNLRTLKTILQSILDKYEILETEKRPSKKEQPKDNELPIYLFDQLQFHPKIVEVSRSLFNDGHYASSIFEAFKAVENFVKQKSDLEDYGKQLMAKAFSEEQPIIEVPEARKLNKEVQEGFKFMFMGASLAIRNPKAHQNVVQDDPFITLEYLGFASFLLKRIPGWRVKRKE